MSRDLLWVCLATPALLPVLCCAPGPSPKGRQLRAGEERGLGSKGRSFPRGLPPEGRRKCRKALCQGLPPILVLGRHCPVTFANVLHRKVQAPVRATQCQPRPELTLEWSQMGGGEGLSQPRAQSYLTDHAPGLRRSTLVLSQGPHQTCSGQTHSSSPNLQAASS